jgi:hypothetical protein
MVDDLIAGYLETWDRTDRPARRKPINGLGARTAYAATRSRWPKVSRSLLDVRNGVVVMAAMADNPPFLLSTLIYPLRENW